MSILELVKSLFLLRCIKFETTLIFSRSPKKFLSSKYFRAFSLRLIDSFNLFFIDLSSVFNFFELDFLVIESILFL